MKHLPKAEETFAPVIAMTGCSYSNHPGFSASVPQRVTITVRQSPSTFLSPLPSKVINLAEVLAVRVSTPMMRGPVEITFPTTSKSSEK
jgi:hypothetical protein